MSSNALPRSDIDVAAARVAAANIRNRHFDDPAATRAASAFMRARDSREAAEVTEPPHPRVDNYGDEVWLRFDTGDDRGVAPVELQVVRRIMAHQRVEVTAIGAVFSDDGELTVNYKIGDHCAKGYTKNIMTKLNEVLRTHGLQNIKYTTVLFFKRDNAHFGVDPTATNGKE